MSGSGFISGRSPGSHTDDFENPLAMNISRMSEMELDKEFEKMLDNMNLSDLKKEPLRRLEPHKKREMLTMHNKTNTRASVSITIIIKSHINGWKCCSRTALIPPVTTSIIFQDKMCP